MRKKTNYLIGIDEVGRGCLAGPVTVAVLLLPGRFNFRRTLNLPALKDSKKLSAQQRHKWFEWIKKRGLLYVIARVYPRTIDRINISRAANLAATRAFKKLCSMLDIRDVRCVLLDGGLYLNRSRVNSQELIVKTVVRGDEKYNCIKLASIVAKVTRDRVMKRNHKKFPQYEFDKHKGYGTKIHMAAIKKHGPSKIHRLTFLTKLVSL